jgi:hypothetical protein
MDVSDSPSAALDHEPDQQAGAQPALVQGSQIPLPKTQNSRHSNAHEKVSNAADELVKEHSRSYAMVITRSANRGPGNKSSFAVSKVVGAVTTQHTETYNQLLQFVKNALTAVEMGREPFAVDPLRQHITVETASGGNLLLANLLDRLGSDGILAQKQIVEASKMAEKMVKDGES